MLTAFRKFAKSPYAAVLMGLLIISFAVFGLSDVVRGNLSTDVIKAGSRSVTSAEFQREYNQAKKRVEEESKQPVTLEMASANGFDRQVLNMVATREAFAEMLKRMGIRPSDKLVVAEIQKIPAFFDQISGRFDRKIFTDRLAGIELTPAAFEQGLRDEMASGHFGSAVASGLRTPRAYGALAAIYALEGRDLTFLTITPNNVARPAPATDAQLSAFMRENAAQLTRPELRVLTLVEFKSAPAASGPVDEAELKKLYDFRKDTFSQPELRTFVQIPAKTPAAAQQILARLGRGEDPAAVAKVAGVDAIAYDSKPITAVADRRIGEAAFRMTAGQVAPVQGELGQAVVKVVAITPGRTITLQEARPALEAELRKTAAAERSYAQSQKYDEAHQAGSDLAASARAAGVQPVTIGPVNAQGIAADGRPAPGLTPAILQQAFSLPAGGESELTEAAQGEYFAVRVERVTPPALPALAEVRPQLAQAWEARELAARMEAKANQIAARLRKGETLQAVAISDRLEAGRIPGLTRQAAGQVQVPREILSRAFAAKPGETFVVRTPQMVVVVGQVSNLRLEGGPLVGMIAEQSRPEMTQTVFRELSEAAQVAAKAKLKVRTDVTRARAAIGMEPLPTETDAKK